MAAFPPLPARLSIDFVNLPPSSLSNACFNLAISFSIGFFLGVNIRFYARLFYSSKREFYKFSRSRDIYS